ncbi:NUDIX hydrolase [Yoonia sp.]|uniref:NUDIX hydrolase n=1 Tax=Yoonia sp. TaxID=2212373 RepID=UPI003A4D7E19
MTPVRDAATLIVLRDPATRPAVLMGQRGANVAFMPGKFVFPGGAVDPNDAIVPLQPLPAQDHARLTTDSGLAPDCLAAAAIRELWEETGQIIGQPAAWADPPRGWRGFAASGHRPNGAALRFFFRAVTPVGPPRRFDARFFLADADDLMTDPDDFSRAEDELAHLQWVHLDQARDFDLPFITQVVLAELIAYIARGGDLPDVPFFRNDDEAHLVSRLGGNSPLR